MAGKEPIEKERKHLIRKLPWEHGIPEIEGEHIQQWYLDVETIRIDNGIFLMDKRVPEETLEQIEWRTGGLLAKTLELPRSAIRVRIKNQLNAKLELKGPKTRDEGIELGWELPDTDISWVREQLSRAGFPSIEKIRWKIPAKDGYIWEFDIFKGANEGLRIAEIEYEGDRPYDIPDWIGKDVTDDERLFNQQLATNPITTWDPMCEYL